MNTRPDTLFLSIVAAGIAPALSLEPAKIENAPTEITASLHSLLLPDTNRTTRFNHGADLELDKISAYEYPCAYLPINRAGLGLNLVQSIKVKSVNYGRDVEVVDWGITIPSASLPGLPPILGRLFMELYSKAKLESLAEHEKDHWLNILGYVDYRSFSAQVGPALYQEGRILQKAPKFIVSWHDEDKETLSSDCAAALTWLKAGEEFAAYCKFNGNGDTALIERVIKIERTI